MVCVCILCQEHPNAQATVVLEKPGIEPTTPGLQGILGLFTTSRRLPHQK